MRSKLAFWTYMLLAALVSGKSLAAEKLHIFTENYPPYNMSLSGQPFAHKEEEIAGLCTEMVKALLKRTPLEYSLKLRDLATSMNRSKNKPNHAIYCVSKTDDRTPYFEWIGPLAEIKWTLFAKPGSNLKLTSLDQAKKYRIGGYKGDVMSNYLIERGFNVSTIANDSLNPRRLALDQIDLWVTDGLSGPYVASEVEDMTNLVPALVFKTTPMYMAINKETSPEVLKALQAGFKAITDSGEAKSITDVYMQ
ncbi:ABC-type amino acid transport/signal transduction systems, periplasmic component/domain [Hahella chejuensis KCTC 2396]|uniref:ABC-type amino acid transport/signal transduction systems, periplasmic component/domain n=1 Tax=Hahella chejuensis (strain KCTC 2396) TaxID=349521 RepID=Q2SCQ0_HAHCH|nr:ABC transporter substrate-binding protein [Hahella chejuensis]ABC31574.1 ABC-type amino acid transport/signal transduction systems, periplasmic component/domain [Hahella chejuensis KCTC 2396]